MTGILRNLLLQSCSGTVGVHMNLSLYVYMCHLLLFHANRSSASTQFVNFPLNNCLSDIFDDTLASFTCFNFSFNDRYLLLMQGLWNSSAKTYLTLACRSV